jgi:hypothetical protein
MVIYYNIFIYKTKVQISSSSSSFLINRSSKLPHDSKIGKKKKRRKEKGCGTEDSKSC